MKILFAIPAMNRGGGAQNQIRLVAKNLKARGHEVRVLVFFKKGFLDGDNFIIELENHGVKVDYLLDDFKKNPIKLLSESVKYLNTYKPEALISFLYHSIVLMRIASIFSHVPIHISSFRNAKVDTKFRSFIMKVTDYLSDCMVINSTQYELDISKPNKSYVILNAIDIDYYNNNYDKESVLITPYINDEKVNYFKWITVGRLDMQKNYPMLLKAFKGVIEKYPHTTLRIFGEGKLKTELVSLVNKYNIQDNVEFCGVTTEILNEYIVSDAFVISSSWEGFSNALMEACATGLPSVSTNVSGATEMIQDRKTGYIVPINDHQELKKAMLTVMGKSSEELKSFGNSSKKHILNLCNPETITDKWEKLIFDLFETKQKK